ncbi:hypothetical protein Golax_014241 [Gossypium laxum]|uniref:Uncharacterized protein n=1 Tax=Gossypium laxum TaxID=34288 RepID=A0A7J8ZU54_9ROSI|nr:hypothetical protein [Gossypium laxum]
MKLHYSLGLALGFSCAA